LNGAGQQPPQTQGPPPQQPFPPQTPRPPEPQQQPAREDQEERRTTWQYILEVVVILAIAVAVAIFVQAFLVKTFMVTSSSMAPTIQPGDRLLADRVTYYFRNPHRGDIVVFRYPPTGPQSTNTTNPLYWPFEQIGEVLHLTHKTGNEPFVKRVIAVGGETIQVKKGQVFINGKAIKEPYAVKGDYSDYGPYKVPAGMVFCMGDNRPNSRDSRYIGPVPVRSIIGRAWLRFWPLSRFGRPAG
jgi:signal peptidase I